MRAFFFFILIFCSARLMAKERTVNKIEADSIFVSKSKKEMILFQNGKPLKVYTVSIGENERGHKQQQGDNRTPEGLYTINDRNPKSKYYLNLGISYPNSEDIAKANTRNADPGGEIKIHGYADKYGSSKEKYTRFSSTWGCIGVCNADMKEIYEYVKIGARILIVP